MPKLKWWQWTLTAIVGLGVLSAIGNAGAPDQPKTVKTAADTPVDPLAPLRKMNRDYRDVRLTEGSLHLSFKARDVDVAAMEIERVGRWMAKQKISGADSLKVTVLLGTIDRLGNEGEAGMFNASFASTDLLAANYDNLSWAGLLGLAETARPTSALGLKSVAEWCVVPDNVSFTGAQFCAKALQ